MRRKSLSPDVQRHIDVRVPRDFFVPGNTKPARSTLKIGPTSVPPLCEGWQSIVCKVFPGGLSDRELEYIESVTAIYVIDRLIVLNALPWDHLLADLKNLSERFARLSPIGDRVWLRLWRELPEEHRNDLIQSRVRSVISLLAQAADAATLRAKSEAAAGRKRAHAKPFADLVNALGDLLEHRGMRLSASKASDAKPGPLVKLVDTVMKVAVPAEPSKLREHTHSVPAMTKAVAKVLHERRIAGSARPAGLFRTMLDEISPAQRG